MHFGYRKGQSGGKWVVRLCKGNEQYVVETIGSADDGAMDADGSTILNFAQGQARGREIAFARRQGVPVGTTPPTELRSVMPSAGKPLSAAVVKSSWEEDAPRKKLKWVVTWSSE